MNGVRLVLKVFRRLYLLGNVRFYKLKYYLLGNRVSWGESIKIAGKLDINGPGRVKLGDGVYINGQGGRPVTPYTHNKSAEIIIGDRTFLNNTRFGCAHKIIIGHDCIIGESSLMDTDFHAIDPDSRRRDEPGKIGEVVIGDNVWIGGSVIILKNTIIGSDCTVGAGSVVSGIFPERALIAGNPAKIIRML